MRDEARQRDDEHRETIAKVDEKLDALMAMVQKSVESREHQIFQISTPVPPPGIMDTHTLEQARRSPHSAVQPKERPISSIPMPRMTGTREVVDSPPMMSFVDNGGGVYPQRAWAPDAPRRTDMAREPAQSL